jgi:Ca2+-binding RTX toxin-like protein
MRKIVMALGILGAFLVAFGLPASAGGTVTCTIVGTSGNDRLIGTRHRDVICGRGGNDFIKGRRGNDILFGQGGRDIIISGPGSDDALGGRQFDVLDGNGGSDDLLGEAGPDFLRGFGGPDRLFGGTGNDCLYTVDNVDGNDFANGQQGLADRFDIDEGPPPDQVVNAEVEASCAGD